MLINEKEVNVSFVTVRVIIFWVLFLYGCGGGTAEDKAALNSEPTPTPIQYCQDDLNGFKITSTSNSESNLNGGYYYECAQDGDASKKLGVAFFQNGNFRLNTTVSSWGDTFSGEGLGGTTLNKNGCDYAFNKTANPNDERTFKNIIIDSEKKLKQITVKSIYRGLNGDAGTYTFKDCSEKTTGWF